MSSFDFLLISKRGKTKLASFYTVYIWYPWHFGSNKQNNYPFLAVYIITFCISVLIGLNCPFLQWHFLHISSTLIKIAIFTVISFGVHFSAAVNQHSCFVLSALSARMPVRSWWAFSPLLKQIQQFSMQLLHTVCQRSIVHFHIVSHNIKMDKNWRAYCSIRFLHELAGEY